MTIDIDAREMAPLAAVSRLALAGIKWLSQNNETIANRAKCDLCHSRKVQSGSFKTG